jgi:hypothetical protein
MENQCIDVALPMHMTLADIFKFISKEKLGVLSSISAGGTVQSALVGIAATPELEIVFDTLNTTRKFHNLTSNPRCSLVIGWSKETTVQFEGAACLPTGPELDRYRQIYFTIWPDGPSRLNWPGLVHFLVTPIWIRYSDFDQSPPLIQEFSF